ncbi:hypothetical protein Ccel01_29110 [Cellulosimicrobium cellulans]|uniref:Uncharacterized protein n=1 Tax=Cellulosimicrobium cellulans TaxID=1710 RepID=A0AAV5PDA0_CELCE|nr:hypothetical protein Ccel01_29110 [Cellulosimicrobium cellulans]
MSRCGSTAPAPVARPPLVVPVASETLVIWTSLVPDARVRAPAGPAGLARSRVGPSAEVPTGSFATSRLGSRSPPRRRSGPPGDLGPEAGGTRQERPDSAVPRPRGTLSEGVL